MAILYKTLILLCWPWNTGLRCAPPIVILRGFVGCAGLIPSRPEHEECRHLIVVHKEPPRCGTDAKFGLVTNVESAISHEGRAGTRGIRIQYEGGKYRPHYQLRLR